MTTLYTVLIIFIPIPLRVYTQSLFIIHINVDIYRSLGYGLDDRGSIPDRGRNFFLFVTAFRPALGSTQPPVQLDTAALSPGVKRPACETDNASPSSTEVKNAWSCTSTPQCAFVENLPLTYKGVHTY